MKTKKLLSLMLTLIVFLSCMSVKVFAEGGSDVADVKKTGNFQCISISTEHFDVSSTANSGKSSSDISFSSGTITITMKSSYTSEYVITKIEGINNLSYSASAGTKTSSNQLEEINATSVTLSNVSGSVSNITISYDLAVKNYKLYFASNLQYDGGVDLKVNNTIVTEAASGATVTASAIAVEGYEAKLSAKDADNGDVTINADGTFVMPAKAVTVTATYTPYTYLDLESTATYPASTDIVQNYTLTQSGDTTYTDVTKVKVEWSLPDISASYTSKKTWNPDTLTWDETKTTASLDEKTATFTVTNYSSVTVGAKLSFKKEIGTASTKESDVLTLQSIVNPDTHVQQYTETPSGTLTYKFTPIASDFNSLEAGTGKYGTYTISIVSAVKVSFDLQGHGEAIDAQYVGIGGKLEAPTAPTATGYAFGGWYKEAACTNAWDFTNDTVTSATTLYAKWQ